MQISKLSICQRPVKKIQIPGLLFVKDLGIKMQMPEFFICQRSEFLTLVYMSRFLLKNFVIYPNKLDY